ncbi:MAG TPA: 2,3-dihydroxybiphenyl 1,2-dioxygenase [Chloroflexota bacterium]|jgi:protocatechuate 4,5-dioxygenase beta chain
MAKLVEIIGVTHNPSLPGHFHHRMDEDPALRPAWDNFALMREKLAAARPDVVIVAAGDHLNQWFMDNLPPFVVGKAPLARGPFPHELSAHELEPYQVEVDVAAATALLTEGYERGVDFAFSDEFLLDHAFTMPLTYIRPERDVPIVPLWTNVMAPPIPPAQRFYNVGLAIHDAITAMPADKPVAVLASGHMANSIGGPGMLRIRTNPEPEFDLKMKALLATGDAPTVIQEASWDKLIAAGNGTPGFLDFVLALGVAGGTPPSYVALNSTRITTAQFFMTWDAPSGGAL